MFLRGTRRTLLAAAAPTLYSFRLRNTQAFCTAKENKIVLYQYKICPFCNRVKAYLDYNKIDYSVVEVNPLTKSQISFSKDHKKVPIADINGEIVSDSFAIIQKLRQFNDQKRDIALFTKDTDEWSVWSEKKLAVMLYPNITRNLSESWEAFSYTLEVEAWGDIAKVCNRFLGPIAMYFANGKIKKKYGIVDERAELKAVISEWTNAIKGKKFLHGDTITMPDLLVYGVLHAIDGFQTFYEVMGSNQELRAWYDHVEEAITNA